MKTFERILSYVVRGGIFLVPFVPVVVSNQIFFPFISGKNFAFRIIVEIIVASWLILALLYDKYRPRASAVMYAVLAFVGVTLLATIFSENPYKSFWSNFERMEGYITILHLFGYFLVLGVTLRTERLWQAFWYTIVGVGFFEMYFALLQYGGELAINQGGVRVDATFGNAIYLSIYMLLTVFLVGFLCLRYRKEGNLTHTLFAGSLGSALFLVLQMYRIGIADVTLGVWGSGLLTLSVLILGVSAYAYWGKVSPKIVSYAYLLAHAVLMILGSIVIVLTATRGTLLGLIGGIGVTIVLMFLQYPASRKYAVAGMVALVIAVGVFWSVKDLPQIREHKILGRFASISSESDDAKARFRVWKMARLGAAEHPILGWGQESFNLVFNKYYDPAMYNREPWFDRTHNAFFDWLVAAGALGLLSYVGVVASGLWVVNRRPATVSQHATISAFSIAEKSVLTGLFAGYLIHSVFAFDNLVSYIVLFSVLAFLHQASVAWEGTETKEAGRDVIVARESRMKIMAPVILLGLFGVLYYANVRPMVAGNFLLKGLRNHEEGLSKNYEYFTRAFALNTFATSEIREQLAQLTGKIGDSNASAETKKAFFDLAKRELEAQVARVPNDARYQLFLAVLHSDYGQYKEALPLFLKALELSPNKQPIIYQVGTAYINLGEPKKALPYFKQAYDLAPESRDAQVIYAVGAVYAEDWKLSDELFEKFKKEGTQIDYRLAKAYFSAGKYDKVIEIWEEGVRREPNNAQYHLYLAGALLQDKQVQRAVDMVRKAAQIDPALTAQTKVYIDEIRKAYPNIR